MVASRKLTTEEVDALIAGMGEDDAGPAPARTVRAELRSYRSPLGRMTYLCLAITAPCE